MESTYDKCDMAPSSFAYLILSYGHFWCWSALWSNVSWSPIPLWLHCSICPSLFKMIGRNSGKIWLRFLAATSSVVIFVLKTTLIGGIQIVVIPFSESNVWFEEDMTSNIRNCNCVCICVILLSMPGMSLCSLSFCPRFSYIWLVETANSSHSQCLFHLTATI